jgi:S1-C subfamily serine protease
MFKKISKILFIFIFGIAGGIFADQILWPYFIEKPLFSEYRLEQTPIYVTEIKQITVTENTALQDAIERVENTIVGVSTQTVGGIILQGSGIIVTSDGLFVTLNDLVPKGSVFSFFVDEELADFQILKRDAKENLALIKVEKSNLPTLSFADFEKIKLGQRVFLIGIVFEKAGIGKTVNQGIIKSFNDNLIETNIFEQNTLAGSPLFDIHANIVGLNQINKDGKVFSIPVSKIKEFIGL